MLDITAPMLRNNIMNVHDLLNETIGLSHSIILNGDGFLVHPTPDHQYAKAWKNRQKTRILISSHINYYHSFPFQKKNKRKKEKCIYICLTDILLNLRQLSSAQSKDSSIQFKSNSSWRQLKAVSVNIYFWRINIMVYVICRKHSLIDNKVIPSTDEQE